MHRIRHDRLVRVSDGWLAGVCGGIARRLGISETFVRIAWLVAALFFGTGLLLYAVLWWVMPHERHLPLDGTVWVQARDGKRRPPLVRTTVDRKIFGVCGGLARRYHLDPAVVRLAVLALATVSVGAAIVVYLVAVLLVPREKSGFAAAASPLGA